MVLYVITNRRTGMEYVGTTIQSARARWREHLTHARRGTRQSPLYAAMRMDGVGSFDFAILDTAMTYEELLEKERAVILTRGTLFPRGYNLVKGGRGNFGWKMREDTRAKIAAKAIGRSAWNRGVPLSAETRQKLSAIRRASPSTPAQLDARRRNGSTPEARAKISAAAKARWAALSPEERERRFTRLRGLGARPLGDAGKAKVSQKKCEWWASLTPEQRADHVQKMTAYQKVEQV